MRHGTMLLLLVLCGGCFDGSRSNGPVCTDVGLGCGIPTSLTWRDGVGVSAVNGAVYAMGGNHVSLCGFYCFNYSTLATVDAYDPVTTAWTTKAPLPTPRHGLGVGTVDGVIYAIGGAGAFTGNHEATNYKATVEAYDPVADSWTTKAPMPTPRYGLGVGVVTGVLYAVGGEDSSHAALATVEAYDPATNSWTTKAPMPTPRYGLGVSVVNGVLYAVGGEAYSTTLRTVEAYDPATNSWTTKAPMPSHRSALGVGVSNGVLYAIGGKASGAGDVMTVEAYDPGANIWMTKRPLLSSRGSMGVGVVNGVFYAVGGYNAGDVTSLEAYDPQDH